MAKNCIKALLEIKRRYKQDDLQTIEMHSKEHSGDMQ